jgi:hypothetical protein
MFTIKFIFSRKISRSHRKQLHRMSSGIAPRYRRNRKQFEIKKEKTD